MRLGNDIFTPPQKNHHFHQEDPINTFIYLTIFSEEQGAEWRPWGGIWMEFWDLSSAFLKLPEATSASNYTCPEGTEIQFSPFIVEKLYGANCDIHSSGGHFRALKI